MGLFSSITKAVGGLVDGISGGDILSAGASLLGGSMANSASSASSDKQMDFQERMSSTSYQRAVKDMMAAGLNPMLAYSQGGASSPSGSSYTAQDVLTPAIESANRTRGTNSAVSLQRAQVDNTNSSTALNRANIAKSMADARLSTAQAASVAADIPQKDVKSQIWRAVQPTATSASDAVRGFSFKDSLKSGYNSLLDRAHRDQGSLDDLLRNYKSK